MTGAPNATETVLFRKPNPRLLLKWPEAQESDFSRQLRGVNVYKCGERARVAVVKAPHE